MDIDDITSELSGASDQILSVIWELDQIPDNISGWIDIEEEFGCPEEVRGLLTSLEEIKLVFSEAGFELEHRDDIEKAASAAASTVRPPESNGEVLTAIKLLASALTNTGVLPRTEPVPTPASDNNPVAADNIVSASPLTFTR